MDGLTLIFPMDGFRLCARTSACQRFFLLAQLAFLHGNFVVFLRFTFLKADRARRAGRQAVSETVAVIVAEELSLLFTIPIAPSWQAFAHRPQPLHFSSSILMIFRIMFRSPLFRSALFHIIVDFMS